MGLRGSRSTHLDQNKELKDPYFPWVLLSPLFRDMPRRLQVPSKPVRSIQLQNFEQLVACRDPKEVSKTRPNIHFDRFADAYFQQNRAIRQKQQPASRMAFSGQSTGRKLHKSQTRCFLRQVRKRN